ncbi:MULTISPECIES: hypothetical protein [unclassified Paenibacillus]|nr:MULTISPECIES: hypothetical protein [unclassified Paenibacillus]MDK8180337.1 hypothetical protein [Paenibacillus sp. UMB4589-SE434]
MRAVWSNAAKNDGMACYYDGLVIGKANRTDFVLVEEAINFID